MSLRQLLKVSTCNTDQRVRRPLATAAKTSDISASHKVPTVLRVDLEANRPVVVIILLPCMPGHPIHRGPFLDGGTAGVNPSTETNRCWGFWMRLA